MAQNGTPYPPTRAPTTNASANAPPINHRTNNLIGIYPGSAVRTQTQPLPPPTPPRPIPTTGSPLTTIPTVFLRPLSRSQLAPTIQGGGNPIALSNGIGNPPSPPLRPISLDAPRPNSERHKNLYCGAPLPGAASGTPARSILQTTNQNHHHHLLHPILSPPPPLPPTSRIPGESRTNSPITTQPGSNNNLTKPINSTILITPGEQIRLPTRSTSPLNPKSLHRHHRKLHKVTHNNPPFPPSDSSSWKNSINSNHGSLVVTSEPSSNNSRVCHHLSQLLEPLEPLESCTKGGSSTHSPRAHPHPQEPLPLPESSIICPICRKCRCEACATPRPLPSAWICSKSVKCGAEPILDYVSCLCCVKALFYHCGKNHEADGGVQCADRPCSCAPHRRWWRWGCMGGMSLVLPCLCFYWPCRGALCMVEKAYQSYHSNGCKCPTTTTSSSSSSSSPGAAAAPASEQSRNSSRTVNSNSNHNNNNNSSSSSHLLANLCPCLSDNGSSSGPGRGSSSRSPVSSGGAGDGSARGPILNHHHSHHHHHHPIHNEEDELALAKAKIDQL